MSLYFKLYKRIKRRANEAGVPFNIVTGDLQAVIIKHGGVCAISGLPFSRPGSRDPFTLSFDRINPKRGYTRDNIRPVLMGLNSLKGEGSDEDLLQICRAVVARA